MTSPPGSGRVPLACVVYHGPGLAARVPAESFVRQCAEDDAPPAGGAASAPARRRRHTCAKPADDLFSAGGVRGPGVLVMDASMLPRIDELRLLPRHLVIVTADEQSESALGGRARASLVGLSDAAVSRAIRSACELSTVRLIAARRKRRLRRSRRELNLLPRIGVALMDERDQGALMRLIIGQGKRLTESDAACILLTERDEQGTGTLRLTFYEADSLPDLPRIEGMLLPIDNSSIIGHSALTREPINIADAYALPPDALFVRNPEFDRSFGYHIKSMLAVPMLDREQELVGMLVFFNRKREPTAMVRTLEDSQRWVLRYTGRQMRLARGLASVAAVSIENSRLHMQIEQIFESFVKAAVSAIDQRDPTTAGHSVRVASLTTDLAVAVERSGTGRYRDVRFTASQMRELHFAALLHDLGKITVHEDVLVKAKKLPPLLRERIDARFDLIHRTLELEHYRSRATHSRGEPGRGNDSAGVLANLAAQLDEIEYFRRVVRESNEPTVVSTAPNLALFDLANRRFERPDCTLTPYLTPEELHFLQIPHGTLDERERSVIESHVEQTYQFLRQIPWTSDLRNVATYAYGHHEKLDGTGYPRRLQGEEIPLQARLMTVADIFDALTESDRPYKAAVAPDQAIDILRAEAKAGLLDVDLVEVMIDSQVYRRILETDWQQL